jgi:Bacteriophage translational regulator
MIGIQDLVEVTLKQPDDFLKVRETLTRIGVASKKDNTLFQSCHILHKQGKYYIVHFKEMFALDGKETDLSENDLSRRNAIAKLLQDWGLVSIVLPAQVEQPEPITISQIKIIPHKEKKDWQLVPKYNIGGRKSDKST